MKLLMIGILSLMAFIHCGGGSTGGSIGSSSSGSDGFEFSGQNLEGGVVSELEFDQSDELVISFEDVDPNAEYFLQLFSFDENGQNNYYEVNGSSSASLSSSSHKLLEGNQNGITTDFHERLRELENDLDLDAVVENSNSNLALRIHQAIGDQRQFKVLNNLSGGNSYDRVNATLVYETENFKAWIDNRNLDSLEDEEIENLFENFNDVIPTENEMFGNESDVDGDGKFNILLTQTVNEIGASAGGIVTGFFYAVDLFSTDQYEISNQTEVFYTFVPDPTAEFGTLITKDFALSNILPGVLPHEYQHMINFNQHYFQNNGSPESSFLNEALSHLAEDIYSLDENDFMTETGNENPARVAGYLNSSDTLCFTCGSSLYQRGGSYLLVRYLYEQAELGNFDYVDSGMEMIQNLTRTSDTGVTNIVNATYGGGDVDTQFRGLLGQFGLAVFLSNTNIVDDDRFEFTGINLRGAQDDNRGTVLQGPRVRSLNSSSLSQSIAGTALSYIQLSGQEILDMDNEVLLELTDSSDAGVYLIQTGL